MISTISYAWYNKPLEGATASDHLVALQSVLGAFQASPRSRISHFLTPEPQCATRLARLQTPCDGPNARPVCVIAIDAARAPRAPHNACSLNVFCRRRRDAGAIRL